MLKSLAIRLNTDDLLKKILPKALFSLLATIATQHNILLDKVAYEAAATAFSIQKCNDEGNYVNNLKTQRWNYPLSQMTEDEVNWVYRMVPMQRIVDIIGADHTYFYTFNLVGDPMQSAKELGVNMPVGNLYSSDTFYDASASSLKWAEMGVLAIEMEAAALYCNAAYTKKRGLSLCSISDNILSEQLVGVDADGGHAHAGGHDGHADAVIRAGVALHAADVVDEPRIFKERFGNEFRAQRVAGHQDSFGKIAFYGAVVRSRHI